MDISRMLEMLIGKRYLKFKGGPNGYTYMSATSDTSESEKSIAHKRNKVDPKVMRFVLMPGEMDPDEAVRYFENTDDDEAEDETNDETDDAKITEKVLRFLFESPNVNTPDEIIAFFEETDDEEGNDSIDPDPKSNEFRGDKSDEFYDARTNVSDQDDSRSKESFDPEQMSEKSFDPESRDSGGDEDRTSNRSESSLITDMKIVLHNMDNLQEEITDLKTMRERFEVQLDVLVRSIIASDNTRIQKLVRWDRFKHKHFKYIA